MTEPELARQLKQHLESLAGAGVAWLPRGSGVAEPLGNPVAGSALDRDQPAAASEPATTSPAPAKSAAILEQRRTALALLAEEVVGCTRCPELVKSRTQTVFGVGPPGVELCFVGEAPGADEDAQGEPFVGAAGQLLNRIIGACGFQRSEVYICNTLKCRPPGNRTPLPDEMGNCRGFLKRQLELVQPRFICALGGSAAQSLLQTGEALGRMRRRFHDYHGIPVICTYHPAYLLPHRSPEKKKEVWEDMKMLLEKMGRPIPTTKTQQ
ncbi:MAG: uracil-DNA glycosylase family protein [Gemmataceae bacterium]